MCRRSREEKPLVHQPLEGILRGTYREQRNDQSKESDTEDGNTPSWDGDSIAISRLGVFSSSLKSATNQMTCKIVHVCDKVVSRLIGK